MIGSSIRLRVGEYESLTFTPLDTLTRVLQRSRNIPGINQLKGGQLRDATDLWAPLRSFEHRLGANLSK